MGSTEVGISQRTESMGSANLTTDRYLQLLKENKERGYMGREKNYVPGVDGPSGGPEIQSNYPTPQQALGFAGMDRRPGNTTGFGAKDKLY